MDLNELKHINYKEQMERLNKSMKLGFYLESIFIEYNILEERTEAILIYCNSLPKPTNKSGFLSINSKINKIKDLSLNQHKHFLDRYFDEQFLNAIHEWKEKRNPLIHSLLKRENHTIELKALSEEGLNLVKKLQSKSINYKKYLQRRGKLHSRDEIKWLP